MIEVLWFVDRLGNQGDLASIWLRELNIAGIKPTRVRSVSLHRIVHGQLLTRYANRQAPTWEPSKADAISAAVRKEIKAAGPTLKAVVLASPESLAILGMLPEIATLGKLRGSVYEIDGVPALVCLPTSAWLTKVSTKEIQNANFGAASRAQLESRYDRESGRPDAESNVSGDGRNGRTESDNKRNDSNVFRGSGTAVSANSVAVRGNAGSVAASDSAVVADNFVVSADFDSDAIISADVSDGESDGEVGESEDNSAEDDEDGDDKFFYVPVMVPVGKMMIRFDMGKLGRIVNGEVGKKWKPL